MTCKDCIDHDKCKKESKKNEYMRHKMWQLDFWENAHQACNRFKQKGSQQMKKWQFYLLSFTWGLPLTLIGCIVALVLVIAGYKPKRFGWCWYFEIGKYWGGLELGVFFLKCKYCTNTLMCHEHGHALQNTLFGVLTPFIICIPSAVRYWYREYLHRVKGVDYGDMPDYDSIWFEGQATRIGKAFMQRKDVKSGDKQCQT